MILSHGFGGSHDDLRAYAEVFARKGITAFTFDFIGGGAAGDMTEMSALTEAKNLNAVISYFKKKKASIKNKFIS